MDKNGIIIFLLAGGVSVLTIVLLRLLLNG